MTSTDQQRTMMILTKLLVAEMSVAQAATLMQLSERQVWRLKNAFQRDGTGGPRPPQPRAQLTRRLSEETRQRIVELASTRYVGINDSHPAELLAQVEGISLSRVALRRMLRAAGRANPRRRRAPRYRSRRDRMPQAGLLLQLDGSRHDWLEGRGPWLTLVGAHRRCDRPGHRRHLPRAGECRRLSRWLVQTALGHGLPLGIDSRGESGAWPPHTAASVFVHGSVTPSSMGYLPKCVLKGVPLALRT